MSNQYLFNHLKNKDVANIENHFESISSPSEFLDKRLIFVKNNNNYFPYYSYLYKGNNFMLNICCLSILKLCNFLGFINSNNINTIIQSKVNVKIKPKEISSNEHHGNAIGCIWFSEGNLYTETFIMNSRARRIDSIEFNEDYIYCANNHYCEWMIQAENGKFSLMVNAKEKKISINIEA